MRLWALAATLPVITAAPALPARAQATASVFGLVSPPDRAAASPGGLAVAVNDAGEVMVVYKGHDAENHIVPFSALRVGNEWRHAVVPMPELGQYASSLSLRGLVGGGPEDGFHLVATHYGAIYYWHWQNGVWSAPEMVAHGKGGLTSAGVALDAQHQPVIVWTVTRFHYLRRVGGQWQDTQLTPAIAQRRVGPIWTEAAGVPRLMGVRLGIPLVVSLPANADPGVAGNWVVAPAAEPAQCASVVPQTVPHVECGLDWPHQLVFATWEQRERLTVAWAPVGATAAGQWQSAEIPLPEKATVSGYRLVSNGRGGVGLLVTALQGGEPSVTFHWLGGSGPSAALPLLRPGTDTEASVFRRVESGTLNLAIDDQGVAHVALVAMKRGEVPADLARLWYATVTGGGTATTGPEVTGSGTTEMGREGPAPDFTVAILTPAGGAESLRVPYRDLLRPVIEVTNRGAEYYGDLWIEADIDGALLRLRVPDESNHRLPLYKRGEKRKYYLPEVDYLPTYQADAVPPAVTYDHGQKRARVNLNTGLGRKLMAVRVDPDEAIPEADEDNNRVEVEYVVSDGRAVVDRERLAANRLVLGLNDAGVLLPPRLLGNTQLLRAGYVQRPTRLDVVIGNPRLAGFFLNMEVAVSLDDQEIARQTVPFLDRDPNLISRYLGQTIIYDPVRPKPDLSGAMLHFPVDLTAVAEGQHQLRVVVDPDDQLGDLKLENNVAELDFRVRPPGGTLQVRVVDFAEPHAPVSNALVVLQDLWIGWTDEQGRVEIPDVPGAEYGGDSLWAERTDPEPRFFQGYAGAFAVTSNQESAVAIQLERALTLVGDVRVARTQQLLEDESVEVFVCEQDLFLPGRTQGPHYTIPNVPPGQHTIVAGAYGYRTAETVAQARRTGPNTDECRVDLELVPGERMTVTGQVLEEGGGPLAGALVWLQEGPRATETDANGNYRLERVAVGPGDTVWANAPSHTTASLATGPLTAGQVLALEPLRLGRIAEHFKSVDFDATTWAICEQTAAAGDIPAITVDTRFGTFQGALGLRYHTTGGQAGVDVDQVLVWIEGGQLIQGGVSAEVGLDSLTGVDLDVLKVGPMKDLLDGYGRVFTVVKGINKLADLLTGSVDPSQMHRNGKVTATYTTHTGTEYTQDPLLDIPTSTDVPLAVTFQGGGATKVRVDFIELHDGANPDQVIRAEWYSPGFAVFNVGRHFDLATLEVRLKVAVLNDRLDTGVLGNTSRNLITWKPDQDNWLRIAGYAYEVSYE